MAGKRKLERYEIMNDPLGSIARWPALAADFDRRWVEVNDPEKLKTFGAQLKAAEALAKEIMLAAGVVPERKNKAADHG